MEQAMITASPSTRSLLSLSLIVAPLFFVVVDIMYASRGWDDGVAANLHIVGAIAYGLAALALVALSRDRWQTVLLLVAVVGMIGNAGVAVNTLHISLGAQDLWHSNAATNVFFKMYTFFFQLTFMIAAFAVRAIVPTWSVVLLLVGAVWFPVAHVTNTPWLAVADSVDMVAALGGIWFATRPVFAGEASEQIGA